MGGFVLVVGDTCIKYMPISKGTLQQNGCSTLVKIENISIGLVDAEVKPGVGMFNDSIESSPTQLLLQHNDGTGIKAVAIVGSETKLGRKFYSSQNTLVQEQ